MSLLVSSPIFPTLSILSSLISYSSISFAMAAYLFAILGLAASVRAVTIGPQSNLPIVNVDIAPDGFKRP